MTNNLLVQIPTTESLSVGLRLRPIAISGARTKRASRAVYHNLIRDLQFAIDAGDTEFAPAVKLVICEAVHLAHNYRKMSIHSYLATLSSVKVAYHTLLRMDTAHPVAQRLQAQIKESYNERFWDFLEHEKMLFDTKPLTQTIASQGNVDKYAYHLLKRAFDITAALVLLVLLAPLMLTVALAVRLDSPGPIFFAQQRAGTRRRTRGRMTTWEVQPFAFYKFRSMIHNADQSLHQKYIEQWANGEAKANGDKNASFKLTRDPRITRVGHFIRRTSLDELPQLFNVLKGDMRLVGPRPVPTYEFSHYKPEHLERMAAMPGITGLWQIKGRGRTTFDQQIVMDVEYIHAQSLWYDIKILLLTLPAVLSSKGAR
jgi:lipopolysaccharide/colanic/teichoic acid biosynthesis glycosyltransferase